jgi:hypothetical protein
LRHALELRRSCNSLAALEEPTPPWRNLGGARASAALKELAPEQNFLCCTVSTATSFTIH